MLFRKIKYSISDVFTSLISPTHSPPYFQSFGVSSTVSNETQVQLQDRLLTVLNLLNNPNELLLKKQLWDLRKKQKKGQIYDIQFNDHIEYSLREKLHQLSTHESNFQIVVHQEKAPYNFQQLGELQIYGLLPYRHLNHYISDYTYRIEESKISFNAKEQVEHKRQLTQMEAQQEAIKGDLQDELLRQSGLFRRAKTSANKLSRWVLNMSEEEQQKQGKVNTSFRIRFQEKEEYILVRDYSCDFSSGIGLVNKDNNLYFYVPEQKWVSQQEWLSLVSKQTLYFRTEAWINSKESNLTQKNKTQVLTDLNWIMKGNPWVWVKRFDIEDEQKEEKLE